MIVTPGWISVWDGFDDPISAVRDLIARLPDHPYALAEIDALEQGLHFFREFSAKLDLGYQPVDHGMPCLGSTPRPALVPPSYASAVGDSPLFIVSSLAGVTIIRRSPAHVQRPPH
ncbi:MAG: hypothetical protein U0528_05995 [Anaerolineae bacterium]